MISSRIIMKGLKAVSISAVIGASCGLVAADDYAYDKNVIDPDDRKATRALISKGLFHGAKTGALLGGLGSFVNAKYLSKMPAEKKNFALMLGLLCLAGGSMLSTEKSIQNDHELRKRFIHKSF